MSGFKTSAKIERELLYDAAEDGKYTVTMVTTGQFDNYDAVCVRDKRMEVVEIKVRGFEDTTYPTAYIEVNKIKAIIEEFKSAPMLNLAYYAFYPLSKKLYIFDILNTPHTMKLGLPLPKTTNGNKELVPTDVYEYPLSLGVCIDLTDEFVNLVQIEDEWGF
jgi:Holliday junction resolvase